MKTLTNSILDSLSSKKLVEAVADSPMGLLGQALDTATSMGWSYDETTFGDSTDGYEFFQYSPAGEDFSFTAECGSKDLSDDEKGANLIKDITDYAYNGFDEDEHIEMWMEARGNGVSGVPGTRELVNDAEEIHSMLRDLADELKKINHPMNESYVYNWKDDIEDVTDTNDDDLFYFVAENIVDKDEYGEYKDRDRDDSIYEVMSNIINLFKISKRSRLYKYLLKWYGSEEELLKKVRDVYETNDAIYFVTGSGYSLFDADLLGGNADGRTEKEFDKFVDKEEGLNEGALEPEYSGRKSFYGKAHVNDSDDGGKTLRSYETDIMTIDKDGNIIMLCKPEHLTQTTLRHIREFLQQNGKEPLTKKQLVDLINKGLNESAKYKLTEAGEWDDNDEDNIASKNYLTDIAKSIADSVPGGDYEEAKGFDAYQGPYAFVSSDIAGGELWYGEVEGDFNLNTNYGWVIGTKEDLIRALSDQDELLKLINETNKYIEGLNESVKSKLNKLSESFSDLDNGPVDVVNWGNLIQFDSRREALDYYLGRLSDPDEREVEGQLTIVKNLTNGEKLAADVIGDPAIKSISKKVGDEIKEVEKLDKPIPYSEYKKTITESVSTNKVKLTEAPTDISEEEEEYELVDNSLEDIPPVEVDSAEEGEMSDEEYEEEAEDDAQDTVQDDIEEPWYATTPELDELRDILPDLDYRLFLINTDMICVGRLNGPDIEFLTSNTPNVKDDAEVSESNDKAKEVEERAEENEEDSFEYMWIKAPATFDDFVNQVNVVYLSPEMTDEDKEQYAGLEVSHESLMDYLMNELPEDKRTEYQADQVEEVEDEEAIEEPLEEPIEAPIEEEPIEDENSEDEEEEK